MYEVHNSRDRRSRQHGGNVAAMIIDGRRVRDTALARLRARIHDALVSSSEREDAELERLLRSGPIDTRANTVAVVSLKGGVAKTTSAFLLGNLLASHRRLRVVAVDGNPGFGTLAGLAPGHRGERTLADLLAEVEDVATAAQLRRYVLELPSGSTCSPLPTPRLPPRTTGGCWRSCRSSTRC
jgi:Mrp family chromosome partitioning ATPase